MRVQASGRLGNFLFQWAFALNLSFSWKRKVKVSFDKYHSDLTLLKEDLKALDGHQVTFQKSSVIGNISRSIDYLSNKNPKISNTLQQLMRIWSESKGVPRNQQWLYRGYFQSFSTIEPVADTVFQMISSKLAQVKFEGQLEKRFPELSKPYQVIHLRLGDFKNSDFGVLDIQGQREMIDINKQTVVCSDGDRGEVLSRIGNLKALILTPAETSAWETLAIISGGFKVISSNSTLSWWGAYIASRNGATVYLPDRWRKSNSDEGTSLLFPGAKTFSATFE